MKIFIIFVYAVFASLLGNKFDKYSHFVLEKNDLEVIILGSPLIDNSIVSLHVDLSPLEEPRSYLGLVHLMEHLLADGKGYHCSSSDTFINYISNNSGQFVACTNRNGITFKFTIPNVHLEEVLLRFSELFIYPNFRQRLSMSDDNHLSLTELISIYDEFDIYKNNAECLRDYFSMLHDFPPRNQFFCGNQMTLPQRNSVEIVKELEMFYESKVSAHIMKMVVVTNSSMDVIKDKIFEHFSKIEKRKVEPFNWPLEVNNGQMIKYFSKHYTSLTLSIQVKIEENYPEELKIYDFFAHLLVTSAHDSFYYKLSEYIRSGNSYFYHLKNLGKICVFFKLKKKGKENLDEILSMFVQWVELLVEGGGNQALLYKQYLSYYKIRDFSKPLDLDYIGQLSDRMQTMNIERVLSHNIQYDTEKVKYYFSKIKVRDMKSDKPSWSFNATLGIDAQNIDHELDEFVKGNVYFQTEYSLSPLNFTFTSKDFGLSYPSSNLFSFKGELEADFDGNQSVSISAIEQSPGFWVKTDFPIKSQQIFIKLSLSFECFDVKARQLLKIFFSVVKGQFAKLVDFAKEAGYFVTYTYDTDNRFNFSIHGFGSEGALLLLDVFLAIVSDIATKSSSFKRRKEMRMQYLKKCRNDVYKMYSKHLDDILSNTNEDEIEATINSSQQEFDKFLGEGKVNQLSPLVFIMSTCIDQNTISQYIYKIKSVFKGQPRYNSYPQLNERTFVFGPYLNNPNSIISISKILPSSGSSELEVQQTAFSLLFKRFFRGHFFSCLRRSDRIAYNLLLSVRRYSGINHIEFFIQTSYSLQVVEDRIYEFISKDAPDYLNLLSDRELLRIKNSLLHSLNVTNIDFRKTAVKILRRKPNFDFKPKLVKFLESLTSAQTIRAEMGAILKIISDPKNGFKMIVLGKQ